MKRETNKNNETVCNLVRDSQNQKPNHSFEQQWKSKNWFSQNSSTRAENHRTDFSNKINTSEIKWNWNDGNTLSEDPWKIQLEWVEIVSSFISVM